MFDDFDWMDINHDGEVDVVEMELVFGPVESTGCEDKEDEEDVVEDALASVGLDRYDLEDMDEEERREALEEAGFDPDDWD